MQRREKEDGKKKIGRERKIGVEKGRKTIIKKGKLEIYLKMIGFMIFFILLPIRRYFTCLLYL